MNRAGFIFAYAVLVVCLPMVFVISQFTSAASFEQRITALTGALAVVVFLNVAGLALIAYVIESRTRKLQQARPVKQPIYIQDYLSEDYASPQATRVFNERASSAERAARAPRRSRRY